MFLYIFLYIYRKYIYIYIYIYIERERERERERWGTIERDIEGGGRLEEAWRGGERTIYIPHTHVYILRERDICLQYMYLKREDNKIMPSQDEKIV